MKKIGGTLLVIILVLAGFALKTYRDTGEFKKIQAHGNEDCQIVEGVYSSEDITIHPQTGLAFISSDDRRAFIQGLQAKQGAIMGYDLTAETPELINLTTGFDQEFHPHGIGLRVEDSTRFSLFVVNHRSSGHFVEIFDFDGSQLVHRESIQGELMTSPNDVIPVGPKQFYVTNDHGNTSALGKTLEEYLQLARSYVLYYDGTTFRKVAKGLAYANGINLSPDGKTVYVAATVSRSVFVYDRDLNDNSLKLRQKIFLKTGVDNIETDADGNLWIGAHPKLLTFVDYSKDPGKLSPSQVIRIRWQSFGNYEVDEVYLSTGRPMSGSSVAAVYNGKMLIGSVFDPIFLICAI